MEKNGFRITDKFIFMIGLVNYLNLFCFIASTFIQIEPIVIYFSLIYNFAQHSKTIRNNAKFAIFQTVKRIGKN